MKNKELETLNFKELLHYDGIPDARNRPTCTGYCISCEINEYMEDSNLELFQMSHGADTEDFENAITKLPDDGFEAPVAFLLESPGGNYENGKAIPYNGFSKEPPVNVYYWLPLPSPRDTWPDKDEADPGSYGKYFAYILAKHKLRNAYFTNVVKCSLASKKDPTTHERSKSFFHLNVNGDPNHWHTKIRINCYNLFLKQELLLTRPQIVFYFGKNAQDMAQANGIRELLTGTIFKRLRHPSDFYHGTDTILPDNDKIISEALAEWRSTNP